ncbi:unnamed protein product [Lampetra fluviatilis]
MGRGEEGAPGATPCTASLVAPSRSPPSPPSPPSSPPSSLSTSPRLWTWEEVSQRSGGRHGEPRWLVVERRVYDVTKWGARHPGGQRLLGHYAGEDATDAFRAFHINQALVQRYLKTLLVGELAPDQPSCEPHKNASLTEDFRSLRSHVERSGLLPCGHSGRACTAGSSPPCCSPPVQAQAGWLQHDFGHLSVFPTSRWNHWVHKFVIGHLKGAPASWWNHLHFQHHAKPNVFRKDPDVNMHPLLFVLGTTLATELGEQKKKYMPYNHQHKYFFLLGPPALIPLYFQWYIFVFAIKRKQWADFAWMLTFYLRFLVCYVPLLGLGGSLLMLAFVRFLESNWFVWVTQMNHIPMNIDRDHQRDWTTTQLQATCNVDQSLFNDWFTGHLNFQIEHHLFPTMPRHNYHKVSPLVKSLCSKHGLDYQSKPLITAFGDIVRSLKVSGDLWQDAYLQR